MRYKISLFLMYGVLEMCDATTFEIGAMIEVDNNVMKQIKEYMKQNKTNEEYMKPIETGNENVESRRNIKDYIKEAVATMEAYDESKLCDIFNVAIDKVKRLTVNNDDTDKAIMKNVKKLEKIPCSDIAKLLNETTLALSGKKYKGTTDWLQLIDTDNVWDNLIKLASSPVETLRRQSYNPDEVVRKTIRNILKVINKIYGYINERSLKNKNILRQHKDKPDKPTSEETYKPLIEEQHKPEAVQHRPFAEIQNNPTELNRWSLEELQHRPTDEVQLGPSKKVQQKPSNKVEQRPPAEVKKRQSDEFQNRPSLEIQHKPSVEDQYRPKYKKILRVQHRPSRVQNKPSRVQNRPSRVQNRPSRVQNKPSRVQHILKPSRIQHRPSLGVQNKPSKEVKYRLSLEAHNRPSIETHKRPLRDNYSPSIADRPSMESLQRPFKEDYNPSTADQETETLTLTKTPRNRHSSKRTTFDTNNERSTSDTETTVSHKKAREHRQKIDEQHLDEVIKPIINILLGVSNNTSSEYTTTTTEDPIIKILLGGEENRKFEESETTTAKSLFKNNRIVLKLN